MSKSLIRLPMSKPKSLITFLLDRSGSMASCKPATITAFNAYLDGLRAETEAEIEITFLQFDSVSLDKICVREPVASAPNLTNESFQPRGATPLVDAAFQTIIATDNAVKLRDDAPKVIVVIQTDGFENASTKHAFPHLSALIAEKQKLGWQFVFLGAGIDAYDQGARMGIGAHNTVSYDQTDAGRTKAVFTASAQNHASFAAGRSADTCYSMKQRAAAGDRFVPADLGGGAAQGVHATRTQTAPVAAAFGVMPMGSWADLVAGHVPPRPPLDLSGRNPPPRAKPAPETELVL